MTDTTAATGRPDIDPDRFAVERTTLANGLGLAYVREGIGPEDHVTWSNFPDKCAVAFTECIGPFVVLGAGHFLQWEQAGILNRALAHFAPICSESARPPGRAPLSAGSHGCESVSDSHDRQSARRRTSGGEATLRMRLR